MKQVLSIHICSCLLAPVLDEYRGTSQFWIREYSLLMLSDVLLGSKKRAFCDYMYWSCEGAPLSRAMVDPCIEFN